jgi:hypothetical protein
MYTMADYTTNVHTLYLNGSVQATDRLRLNGMVSYDMSKGELGQVNMPNVTDRLQSSEGDPELIDQDFTFEHMNEYSDLDYKILRLNGGFEYDLMPGLTWTVDGTFADLTDDAPYVYGDESGSYYWISSGIWLKF